MDTTWRENTTDLKAIAQRFFGAYDAHDVEGMIALCADDARGRYVPYGRESIASHSGRDRRDLASFPQAVPDFRVEVIEMMLAEGNTLVAQTVMSGQYRRTLSVISKQGQAVAIPQSSFWRFAADGKITRLDAYWDNAVLNGLMKSVL